jgi:outer membrane protein OmpA-like peptidoglycan-associated protein
MALMWGCKSSQHTLGQVLDLRDDGEKNVQHLYTKTRHIDSVEDVRTLVMDTWKTEHFFYPDSVRLFVRVLDTTGYMVTHMADPYKRPDAPDYFMGFRESLGSGKNKRSKPVDPFRVREFGDKDSVPVYISLGLDFSGSMKGALDAVEQGTDIFIGMKRPCDFIALTTWNQKVTNVFGLSADTGTMLPAWRKHKAVARGVFSATWDGIMTTMRQLQEVPIDQLKVCVLFADGDENVSKSRAAEVYEYAAKHNISLFVIGFAYAQDEVLQNLALYTGGKYYRAYTKSELVAIFQDIYNSLRNYYRVSYKPTVFDGTHELELTVRVPRKKSGRDKNGSGGDRGNGLDGGNGNNGNGRGDGNDGNGRGDGNNGNGRGDGNNGNGRGDGNNGNGRGDGNNGNGRGDGNNGNGRGDGNNGNDDDEFVTLTARAKFDKSQLIPVSSTVEFTRPVVFAYNRSDIDSSSLYIIEEITSAMLEHPRVEIEIQGHTDNIGGEEFNQRLSEARAESVKRALIARGVEERRLRTRGFGFSMPIASNDTDEGRAKNRRTVFRIIRR